MLQDDAKCNTGLQCIHEESMKEDHICHRNDAIHWCALLQFATHFCFLQCVPFWSRRHLPQTFASWRPVTGSWRASTMRTWAGMSLPNSCKFLSPPCIKRRASVDGSSIAYLPILDHKVLDLRRKLTLVFFSEPQTWHIPYYCSDPWCIP